jgi:spermidine synthase
MGPIDQRIVRLVIATGIASVVSQLLFMREYLSLFQGNEIIIALALFDWLLLGGVGTWLARRVRTPATGALAGWSFALAGLAGILIPAVRYLRRIVFIPGVSVGFYPSFFFILITMAPYALLVGYVLPYSLAAIRTFRPEVAGTKLYLADNLGDVCGGALFGFVLIYWVSPLQAALLAHLPLIVIGIWVAPRLGRTMTGASMALVCLIGAQFLERPSLAPTVGRLIHYEESRYARLTVNRHQEQVTLFADGRPVAGNEDIAQAEAAIHYPLSQLNNDARILLISAGGGMTAEIEKHRPAAVDYVELDPAVAKLLGRYNVIVPIAGMRTILSDGRAWLQKAPAEKKYDAVIMNLPDPDTFQLNRFFTERFFALVKRHLNRKGVFSFQVEGFANYMTPDQRDELSSLRVTAQRHFAHVRLLPGEQIVFLCRQVPIDLDIPARLAARGIETRFVAPFYYGDVTVERMADLEAELDPQAPMNTDTRPYLMRIMFRQWFSKFGFSPAVFITTIGLIMAAYLVRRRPEELVLFTTGMIAMGAETLVIFAFQIFFGVIYVKIGLIVTIFLAGLMPGAWLGYRLGKRARRLLIISDMVLIVLLGAAAGFFHWVADGLPEGYYYLYGFSVSLVCGFQFPLALDLLGDVHQWAVRIFSADLAGAACGALVTSTLLVPYTGLVGAAAILAVVKVISAMLLGGYHAAR